MAEGGIGARVKRKEDFRLLRGRGRYVGDISMPGLLEVAFVRSPPAHARIRSVTRAAGPRGHRPHAPRISSASSRSARFRAFRGSRRPTIRRSRPARCAMPARRWRCASARRAARPRIWRSSSTVELDPLPAVTDALAARQRRAPPLVHEGWGDNLFMTTSVGGDIDEVARTAPVVIKREYRMNRQCMAPLEGKGVLAYWDDHDDQLVVVTSTQSPHMIRAGLVANFWASSSASIRVIAPDVGGGFGYKVVLQPEELCVAWLALTRRHPVRWTEDRREHLTAGANTRQHHYRVTAYADATRQAPGARCRDHRRYRRLFGVALHRRARRRDGRRQSARPLSSAGLSLQDLFGRDQQAALRALSRGGAAGRVLRHRADDRRARPRGRARAGRGAARQSRARLGHAATPTSPASISTAATIPQSVRHGVEQIGLAACARGRARGEPDGRLVGVGFATYTEQSAHGTTVLALGHADHSRLRAGDGAHHARWRRRDADRRPFARPGHGDDDGAGRVRDPGHPRRRTSASCMATRR